MRVECEECQRAGHLGNIIRRYRILGQKRVWSLCHSCYLQKRRFQKIIDLSDHDNDFICLPWSDQ